MKILILTTYQHANMQADPEYHTESTWRLYQHLEKKHNTEIARYNDLDISCSQQVSSISLQETPLENFDAIIFRATTCEGTDLEWITQIVAEYAQHHNIFTINGSHFTHFGGNWNKLRQMAFFAAHSLPIPATSYTSSANTLQYPCVAKPRHGSHGKGIHVVSSEEQFPDNPTDFLFQEVLPDRQDYRVIVLNGKPLGAILRQASGDMFVSNVSAGGTATAVNIDPDMEKLALQVAHLCKLDFCGIDLMKDADGQYRILEVNRNPEFNGFEKATGSIIPPFIEQVLES